MEKNNLNLALAQLKIVQCSFLKWRTFSLDDRLAVVEDIKNQLLENKHMYAKAITTDMNKPISQSLAEVEKCAYLCDYYLENASKFLEKQYIQTGWSKSYIDYQPLGVLLGVMPWNFPFWQVFRFVIPSLITGNTFAIKHASNVKQCAQLLEEVFSSKKINFPIYVNLDIKSDDVKHIIADPIIKAVSLTGSEKAGSAVAVEAGKYLKKCVLELGGSNAFIVLEDADLDKTLDKAVKARMQNAGQSCIAAKRFLVHEKIYDKFLEGFVERVKQLNVGDKFDETTDFSSMAREDLAIELEKQLSESLQLGAELIIGGKRNGSFFEPTVVGNVNMQMPIANQETFGPLAAVFKIKNVEEAIEISNQSVFGLGVSVFTNDIEKINKHLHLFEEGAVFINEMVVSDPHLPFGGIKKSGYGRELSHLALYEFANIRTVVIK